MHSISDILRHIVLPFALVYGLELLYREPLYKFSLDFAHDLQQSKKAEPFFGAISWLGAGQFYAFITVLIFNGVAKPAALYMFSGIVFANYTMNQLKSIYAEPRPYWVTDDVVSNKCHAGFGNPSGHMLNNCFLWFTLYLHVYHDVLRSGEPLSKELK